MISSKRIPCSRGMSVGSRLRHRVHRALGSGAVRQLGYKQYSEVRFWKGELRRYIEWYEGKVADVYGVPAPRAELREQQYGDLTRNAVATWLRTCDSRYPEHLCVDPDAFAGMRVLDIGCGPVPFALGFKFCEVHALDQLLPAYREIGFPFDIYPPRLTWLVGRAEEIPAPADSFDAIVSVNAIDHVDDLPAVAREITRVLRPQGAIRIEAHYHDPTVVEPWKLDDAVMMRHFGHLQVRKLHERFVSWPGRAQDERLVVWGNDER